MTSRATVSPNSMIDSMSSRSSCSITSSSTATSANASSSSSETNGPFFRPLPGRITFVRPMSAARHHPDRREGHERRDRPAPRAAPTARDAGAPTSSAPPRRTRRRSTTLKMVAMMMPIVPNSRSDRIPTSVACDELAHEEHEQQRVEEPLGMADQPQQRPAPPGLLLGERHRLDLVHARQRGLGHRHVAGDRDQHHDDEDHRKVAGSELDGQRHDCSCRKPAGAGPPQWCASSNASSRARIGLPRRPRRGRARARAARRGRRAARSRRRPCPRAIGRVARPRPPGTRPRRRAAAGSRRDRARRGRGPDASGSWTAHTASSSIGNASTSVGPVCSMNRSLSSAIDVSSTKSTESSAAPRTPSAASTASASALPARDVDGDVVLLVGDEHLGPALVAPTRLGRSDRGGGSVTEPRPLARTRRRCRPRCGGARRRLGQVHEREAVDAGQHLLEAEEAAAAAGHVDLGDVAGDDDLRPEADAGEEHLHLLGRRVLRLVEDDEAASSACGRA